MPQLIGVEKLCSSRPAKRFGRPNGYGIGIFARSLFGDSDIYLVNCGKGPILLSGIYRKNGPHGGNYYNLLPYQNPKNPRTIPQQAQRQKMHDAVAGWQGLTTEQKESYNQRVWGKHMSGYNLYLREFILSV